MMRYALWLYSVPGLSGAMCRRLWTKGICAREAYGLSTKALVALGVKEEAAEAMQASKGLYSPEELQQSLYERGIGFVSLEQDEYPERLKRIADPPYGLYYKGSLPGWGRAVAIVGARGRSEYGRQMAHRLGETLARHGISVISGLARGIDADGHRGALHGLGVQPGPTAGAGARSIQGPQAAAYAVLGCGVETCYPKGNQYLYDRILEYGGGILSEYHPDQAPLARLFPSRNRLISGLSDCVVVIEAKRRSGSLITADYAMEQGRDVYALPGRVTDPLSEGCNELIRQGAGILTNTEEFLKDLGGLAEESGIQMDFRKFLLEKDEQLVYSLLDFCPKGVGTLLEQSRMPLHELLDVLGRLEAKGFARESVPNYYVRQI